MVPSTAADDLCSDLTVLDLRNFQIERLMRTDKNMPTFFVYYCTTGGDILGKLMFTEYEMIFEPLNPNLKGFYNYTGKGETPQHALSIPSRLVAPSNLFPSFDTF